VRAKPSFCCYSILTGGHKQDDGSVSFANSELAMDYQFEIFMPECEFKTEL